MDDVTEMALQRMREFGLGKCTDLELLDAMLRTVDECKRLRAALQREVMKNARGNDGDSRAIDIVG